VLKDLKDFKVLLVNGENVEKRENVEMTAPILY
jgi:hypothetical protein